MPRTTPPTRPAARVAAALLLASLPLAACGDDDSAAGGSGATAGPETTTDPAGPSGDDVETVEVTAVDFGFEGLPATVPAGTRLTLVNDAATELHELVAFRVPDDEERAVEDLVALPPGEMMAALGGEPTTVLLAPPGGGDTIAAVGDGTLAEPGRYALSCVIPTGADPEEYLAAAAESDEGPPEVEGGPPHVAHGMFAELVVE